MILGDTPGTRREDALRKFAGGQLDTLIQVGVLIEGWNSPRCKLLIDLAPSMSRVRATQKFFRVMTRLGDAEARIYILLPVGLPALPILPVELFGPSLHSYTCGELIGKQQEAASAVELPGKLREKSNRLGRRLELITDVPPIPAGLEARIGIEGPPAYDDQFVLPAAPDVTKQKHQRAAVPQVGRPPLPDRPLLAQSVCGGGSLGAYA